jgi:predicted CoA-binding protein
MASKGQIKQFFSSPSFGVAGASNDRNKFGNKVLRKYLEHDLKAYPINPNEKVIEGLPCLKSVMDLPAETQSLSIITPSDVTEKIVREAIQKGIKNIWMQPGAQSPKAIQEAVKAGVNLIADGTCVMVQLESQNL